MSKGTFFGDIFRNPLSLNPIGDARKKRQRENEKRDAGLTAEAVTAKAKAETRVAAEQLGQRQKAKQFAAINTPSKGFGSNSQENLSRAFLLRL